MRNEQKGSVVIIVVVVLVVAMAVGAFLFVSSNDDGNTENNSAETTGTTETTEQVTENTEESTENDDESSYEEINLQAVGSQAGEGVAIRSIGDTTFTHQLYVQTTDPPAGKFYEGWLVGDSVVSTGMLEKNSDGNWYLEFTTSNELSNHDSVVVTEETEADGLDGKPELHIFEGQF